MKLLYLLFLSLLSLNVGLSQEAASKASQSVGGRGGSPAADPDVLILTDGEKLIGQMESATDASLVFKSNLIGEVTMEWAKVQELHSSQAFAAIPKNLKPLKKENTAVGHGTLDATNHQLAIKSAQGAPQTMPVGDIGNIVPEAEYQKAFRRSSLIKGWKGGLTAGLSLTEATQNNHTYTAAASFVRSVPAEDWLNLRRRTIFDYTQAYGKLTQPGTPTVKTSLYHIGLEQDWYLSPRVFAFAQAIFDHNFSQGLDLQQTYGGGLGFVVFKTAAQELDFKGSVDYVEQRFALSSQNKNLISSIFGETYLHTFAHGIQFNEQGAFTPAWNDTSAYSAFGNATLTFPVYHHFGLTLGALDNFLNDPPPGFKKNSFEFTAGATYSLK
ncbi:MAG TPA: DUF481 domain-containing protein [Bryobacteraceae bacterium]|nr:DUF481 domain-containing protein [Bryobacteraceae bacterium]